MDKVKLLEFLAEVLGCKPEAVCEERIFEYRKGQWDAEFDKFEEISHKADGVNWREIDSNDLLWLIEALHKRFTLEKQKWAAPFSPEDAT